MRDFPALLAAEWTKLRSVRATCWCAGVFLVVALSLTWPAAATTSTAPKPRVALEVALTPFGFAPLALVVLGVLAMTTEFSTGSAVSTFTAVPRRTAVLAAKTAVVSVFCALLTVVPALVCAVAARTLIAVPGGVPLTSAEVLRPLALQVAGAALLGGLSVALGAVLRSSAGAIGLGLSLVLILPPVLAVTGNRSAVRLAQALPALRVGEHPFLAPPTTWQVGLCVVGGWLLVLWATAAIVLERRDV